MLRSINLISLFLLLIFISQPHADEERIQFSVNIGDSITKIYSASAENDELKFLYQLPYITLVLRKSPSEEYVSYSTRDGSAEASLICHNLLTGEEVVLCSRIFPSIPTSAWFPHGDSLLYYSEQAGKDTIFSYNAQTGATKPYLSGGNFEGIQHISLFSNNQYLCYSSELELSYFELDTGIERHVDAGKIRYDRVSCFQNEKKLIFSFDGDPLWGNKQAGICSYDIDMQQLRQIVDIDGRPIPPSDYQFIEYFSLSNNGRFIAFFDRVKTAGLNLFVVSTNEGKEFIKQGITDNNLEIALPPVWSPDDSKICFAKGLGDCRVLMLYELRSGKLRTLTSEKMDIYNIVW